MGGDWQHISDGSRMIDIHNIPERHEVINQRLEEWGRWVRVSNHGWFTAPMFRMYQSKARQWDENPHIRVEVNGLQALEIERVVSRLPEKHRAVIRWVHVWPWIHVSKVKRELALTDEALAQMIDDSRDMMKNKLMEK